MSGEMRSAVIRGLVFAVLALGGAASSVAVAGAQLGPIDTITSIVGSVTSQTTVAPQVPGVAPQVPGAAGGAVSQVTGEPAGSVAGSDSGVVGGLQGSGADSRSGSGSRADSSSRPARKSNPGSPHTRFDRLPRRYERLLERIESGRRVEANMRRLRALLASASPELRARILRLIRREIARLERGGLTRREQAAVDRLEAVRSSLEGQGASPSLRGSFGTVEEPRLAGSPSRIGAVEAAGASSLADRAHEPNAERSESAIPALPSPGSPLPSPSGPAYWILFLLIAIALLPLLLAASGDRLPAFVRGIAEARGATQVASVALTIALALGLALCVVLWAQALLP